MNLNLSVAGRVLASALVCFSILSALPAAQPTEGRQVISDPAIQRAEGQRIAAEACALAPKASSTNTATLRLFGSNRKLRAEIPVTIRTTVTDDQWHTDYTSGDGVRFRVSRSHNTPSRYAVGRETGQLQPASNLLVPFAGSDFWLVDLGLDFFHWPERTNASASTTRRAAAISSAKAKSAVVSFKMPGVLLTRMPCSVAACKSMLSKPTPTWAIMPSPLSCAITSRGRGSVNWLMITRLPRARSISCGEVKPSGVDS